jgi:hypothetical protein
LESEVTKVEFGDNFAIVSDELENGDPSMSFFATNLCIGVNKHLKMNGATFG